MPKTRSGRVNTKPPQLGEDIYSFTLYTSPQTWLHHFYNLKQQQQQTKPHDPILRVLYYYSHHS